MKNHLRRYAVGAMAAGVIAGGAAVVLPGGLSTWRPVTYGLSQTPEQLLPTTVSAVNPVRVVSTTVDKRGRPVVTVRTATDKTSAADLVKKGQGAKNAIGVEVDAPMSALDVATGTDPYREQQWDLTKIRVADAWRKSTGSGITVAVIDTGVDAAHPDLAGQVLPGIDYVARTSGVSTDPNGHGTHVAGTVAALTGNGVGVSSVAPEAKILPVRVLGADGSGYMSDAAKGIIYAADNGADVINMSLGSTTKVAAVSNAIAYARSEGVVVVAAAGNERGKGSPTSYPAADQGVIAVAATTSADQFASYSNRGGYIDVAAPGSNVVSTYPAATGTGYTSLYGTSMASPHVAAVAALVLSSHPSLTPDEVESAIEKSAVDLGTKGRDIDYGYGRVDAAAALSAADSISPAPTTSATTPATVSPTPSASRTVTPSPTKAVNKLLPVVTANTTSASVLYGTITKTTFKVTLLGKVWPSRPARLCVADPGVAFACTEVTTTTAGTFLYSRAATGSFQVMLVVGETAGSREAASGVVSFTVRSQLTVVRTAAGTVTVNLTGAAGQVVQIQRSEKDRWVIAAAYRAESTHTVSGLIAGQRYRALVLDTPAVVGAISATVSA